MRKKYEKHLRRSDGIYASERNLYRVAEDIFLLLCTIRVKSLLRYASTVNYIIAHQIRH